MTLYEKIFNKISNKEKLYVLSMQCDGNLVSLITMVMIPNYSLLSL